MSFYDDASLVLLAGGAAGKDGKVYNIKPISPAKDFTFARGTDLTATRVGKDGYIEKGRENLLLQSNQFDTTWGTPNTAVTSGENGYDGSQDAWLLEADTAASNANLNQGSLSISGVMTASIYAKEGTTNWFRFSVNDSGVNSRAWFDLSGSGAVGTTTGTIIDTKIESAGNGYFRCSITFNATATNLFVYLANADNSLSYSVGDNIYIQDAQLEQGLVATDYIETGATTATAGLLEDEPRFDYTGGGCPALLIEGDTINLVQNSEYFGGYLTAAATVTQNALVSPEGLQNASTLNVTGNAGSMYTESGNGVESVTASTVYTFSFYVKQGTNTENYLAVRDNTNGAFIDTDVAYTASSSEWTRVEHTFTTPAGCVAVRLYPQRYSSGGQGTTHIWGIQLEANDYATSYIPTYGASATRTYDNPNELTHGITMGTSCSIFLEATNFKVTETGGAQTSLLKMRAATSPTEDDRFLFLGVANTVSTFTLQAQNKKSGETTKTLVKTGLTMGSPFKALARYDGTSFDLFVNGVLEDSETIVADDHFGRVDLKNLTVQAQNGHSISQVILFDSALSDTECEDLTTL